MDLCKYINLFKFVVHRVCVLSVFMWDLCCDDFWRTVFDPESFPWFLHCIHIVLILFRTSIYLHYWGMQLELLKFQPRHRIFRKALSDLQSAQLKSQWNGTKEKGIIEAQSLKLIFWFFHIFSALSMTHR